MNLQKQKAFTLVELIVTILILTILWTIALISLEWYSKDARDSARISDVNNIKFSLDSFSLYSSRLPLPDNAKTVSYNWQNVWYQWSIWDDVVTNLKNLDNKPLDPLFVTEYIYSVTNDRKEYEILSLYESDNLVWLDLLSDTYAADKITPKIDWTYNKLFVKTSNYIVPTPSIINSEANTGNLILGPTNIKSQIITWWTNNLKIWTNPSSTWWLDINLAVYTWSINNYLSNDDKLILIDVFKKTYDWSELSNNGIYEEILKTTEPEQLIWLVNSIVFNDSSIDVNYVPPSFLSVWDTTLTSIWSSSNNQVMLPLESTWTYNFTVDWWDWTIDTITAYNQSEVTHTYASTWIYTIKIDWEIKGFRFNNSWDKLKILEIKSWGDLNVWNNWSYFRWTSNLNFTWTDSLDLTWTTSLYAMFWDSSSFNWNINNWDVSNVTNMNSMFRSATSFNQPLNSWDVSNVNDVSSMFRSATSFNQPLNSWDVSNFTNVTLMFYFASSFNQPLDNWTLNNITSTYAMFRSAISFNQSLDNWDVSNVTNMFQMFYDNKSFNQPLNSWDVSNVNNMSYMFWASAFNQPLDKWDVSSVTNMASMFEWTSAFNQPLNSWTLTNVTDINKMFQLAKNFNQPLDKWDVSNVTNMDYIFYWPTDLTSIFNQDLTSWTVSQVTYCVWFNSYAASWLVSNQMDFAWQGSTCTP